jgi:hypothetical protein
MTILDCGRYGVDDSFQRGNVPDPFAAPMFVTRVSLAICILRPHRRPFYAKILPLPTSAMKKNERLAGSPWGNPPYKFRVRTSHAHQTGDKE